MSISSPEMVSSQQRIALARPTRVNSLVIDGYQYPFVRFTADVSSGTYIRSLVEDMGKSLGTGAYMSDLRRTRVGQFNLENAVTIDDLSIINLHMSILGKLSTL